MSNLTAAATFMLQLSSEPQSVKQIEPYVDHLVHTFNIGEEIYGNILISLTEAVNNAIVHGNKNDGRKCVTVELVRKIRQISFFVKDEGDGFDHTTLPDPTAPENLLKIGGRGIFLMRQLSDTLNFYDNGKTVEIQFNL